VRLVSEPGRAMPIWASSSWICWLICSELSRQRIIG
jgi:hypothetical protein